MKLSESAALALVETGCWRCLPENMHAKTFTVCADCDRDFLFEAAGIKVWLSGDHGPLWMVKLPELDTLFYYAWFDNQAMNATPEIGWFRSLKLLRSIARIRRENPGRFISWRLEAKPHRYPTLVTTNYVKPGVYIAQYFDPIIKVSAGI